MSEMEKAQILHNLISSFDVSENTLEELKKQISDPKIKNNFQRITTGLKVEDNYRMIFSALPWIKNINGLHQQQEKRHKEKYQAPDYSLLVENSQNENFPLFVDVKSVKGKKITCEIMPKQIATLKNYARDHNAGLLVAIYWEIIGYWTHNCLESFGGKKKNKISLEEAFKNDLSHILSDYSFIIDEPFYRKTIFTGKQAEGKACHKDHGEIKSVHIGRSLEALKEYSILESSAVDSAFKMTEIEVIEKNGEIEQIEKSQEVIILLKLSRWLISFANIWSADFSERIKGRPFTEYARIFSVNLMKELGYNVTYQIPEAKNKCTDYFFERAYKDTYVHNSYKESNSI